MVRDVQRLQGLVRKAIGEYDMIRPGDRIAVGVSGGKDSVALLAALAQLRYYIEIPFEVTAITLDMGFSPTDWSPVEELCRRYEIPYIVKKTDIGPIIFEERQETNPCSLCARMRRGALHDAAKEAGCGKIALGHHMDDAIETFFMNLFNEGRIGCFSPVTYLSRKDLWMIRPLVFAQEFEIRRAVQRGNLPVVKSKCPADGVTNRQHMKEWIAGQQKDDPGFKRRIFGALRRSGIDGW